MIYIKMFGVERAGARFAATLFYRNFRKKDITIVTELGEPHDVPLLDHYGVKEWLRNSQHPTQKFARFMVKLQRTKLKMVPIIVTKNPYTWYKSIHRWRRLKTIDWNKEFNLYNTYHSIFKQIIINHKSYQLYHKGLFIKYEDLIENTPHELDKISSFLKVPRKEKFKPVTETFDSRIFKNKDFYLSEGPWNLSPTYLKKITNHVDWETMSFFGYNPVEPEDFYDIVIYEEDYDEDE